MSDKVKYGFVYIWYDRKHKRYYIGCHWGSVDDGYVCSSSWMKQGYLHRPQDFKRRILKTNIENRQKLYEEEQRWLSMIKPEEIKPINNNPRYYNLNTTNNEVWHKYDEKIKTVGEKISAAKKGKKTGPRNPSVGETISKAKKGKPLTEEHKQALRGIKKKSHTDEWKKNNSARMIEQWNNGTRKRAEPKQTMSREEQDKICSIKLKERWADPIWAANQRAKLKEARNRRCA